MGNKYEIYAWGPHDEFNTGSLDYSNKQMWRGQSWIAALYNLWKIKRQGWGCVKLECR